MDLGPSDQYLIGLKIAQSDAEHSPELTATACDRKSPEQESWEQKAKCSLFSPPAKPRLQHNPVVFSLQS